MLDNQLIELFLPVIQSGLAAGGYTDVVVKAGNQPTQQGINTGPTVYFYKLYDKRYGYLQRSHVYNVNTGHTNEIETQNYETTFQINALVLQDPKNISYTASDLVNRVAAIMQSDATRATLAASSVGIFRIQEVINPWFVDDKGRYEASPSFKFTLTHQQITSTIDPNTNVVNFGIYPV
jgi:hypothetical protein